MSVYSQVYPRERHYHNEHDFIVTPEQLSSLHVKKATSNLTALWADVNGFPLIPYAFYDGVYITGYLYYSLITVYATIKNLCKM